MTASPRRRLVMIVDNQVRGDSRVQKMARSCADAGFDVHLVGRTQSDEGESWTLGGAQVTLLPSPLDLLTHAAAHPGRSLRWPLAYPSRDRDATALRHRAVRRSALADRETQVQLARANGGAGPLAGLRLSARRAWVFGLDAVHALRHRQLSRALRTRRAEASAWDRARVRWLRLRLGTGAWRRLDPTLVDFELAMLDHVVALQPDLVHAHDFRMIGIGVRAAEALRAAGRDCRVVYDAHEYLPGIRRRNLSWHVANELHETVHVPRTDAVVTVSDRLAEMLVERHHLAATPTVVLNAPLLADDGTPVDGGLRAACGLADGVPLLVYIGSPAPQRGIPTLVEGLVDLPGVHGAVLLPPGAPAVAELEELAAQLGVADRFHALPYVAPDDVVPWIRSADVGVIPLHHQINHEISLITKYFDYIHAGLPIVVSDVETMARTTRELGNGEVFTAESTAGFVAAVRKVLDDRAAYTAAYTPELVQRWSWEAQADRLVALYDSLVPPAVP